MHTFMRLAEPVLARYLLVSGFLLSIIGGAMFCIMLLANGYNIALRTATGQGIVWHQEISIMAAFWIYFAAYALLAKERRYMTVEFLFDLLPASAMKFLFTIITMLTISFHVCLAYLSMVALPAAGFLSTPVLGWPEQIYFLPLLVGSADIAVTETIILLRLLSGASYESVNVNLSTNVQSG